MTSTLAPPPPSRTRRFRVSGPRFTGELDLTPGKDSYGDVARRALELGMPPLSGPPVILHEGRKRAEEDPIRAETSQITIAHEARNS